MERVLKRWRYSLFFNLILLVICAALFVYARHSDQNLRESQIIVAKQAQELQQTQEDLFKAQIRSCARDNVLRQERNAETKVIQNILDQIVANAKKRAVVEREQGNYDGAKLSEQGAKQYQGYRDELNTVDLTNCETIVPRRG